MCCPVRAGSLEEEPISSWVCEPFWGQLLKTFMMLPTYQEGLALSVWGPGALGPGFQGVPSGPVHRAVGWAARAWPRKAGQEAALGRIRGEACFMPTCWPTELGPLWSSSEERGACGEEGSMVA